MLKVGDKVKVIKCEIFAFMIGQMGHIIPSDDNTKYKVQFTDSVVGYYTPTELEKIEDNYISMEMNDMKKVCVKLHDNSCAISYNAIVEIVDKAINKALKNRQGTEAVTKVTETIPYDKDIQGFLSCNLCYNHKTGKIIYAKLNLIVDTAEYEG